MFALEDKAVRGVRGGRGNQLRINVEVMRGQLKIIGRIGKQMGSRLQEETIELSQNYERERGRKGERGGGRESKRGRGRVRERQRERERRASYIFHPRGDHESVTGLEQPDGIFVSNSNQVMTVHINQLITNLHVVQLKSIQCNHDKIPP